MDMYCPKRKKEKKTHKKPNTTRVVIKRVNMQEIARADVSNCALTDRCSCLSNTGNALVQECKKCWQVEIVIVITPIHIFTLSSFIARH